MENINSSCESRAILWEKKGEIIVISLITLMKTKLSDCVGEIQDPSLETKWNHTKHSHCGWVLLCRVLHWISRPAMNVRGQETWTRSLFFFYLNGIYLYQNVRNKTHYFIYSCVISNIKIWYLSSWAHAFKDIDLLTHKCIHRHTPED